MIEVKNATIAIHFGDTKPIVAHAVQQIQNLIAVGEPTDLELAEVINGVINDTCKRATAWVKEGQK